MVNLLQITEPGQTNSSSENASKAIGIDLGTTNSLVAHIDEGQPVIIPMKDNKKLLPSVVSYLDGYIKVGRMALDDLNASPDHVIKSVKRLMGVNESSPDQSDENVVRINAGTKKVTPIEVSAEILKTLKSRAEEALNQEVSDAVITVPAYFDEAARKATKDAARLAGLNVLRLLNEPTAAALAYGLDTAEEGIYAVYDLGGGTFDLSLLRLEKGLFQVLATGGDTALGGDDIDDLIVDKYLKDLVLNIKLIKAQARRIKEELSSKPEALLPDNTAIKRAEFNKLINPIVQKTIGICTEVLNESEIEKSSIKGVIMVGGATRIPHLQEEVGKFFGIKPHTEIDPDCAVVRGAAIQAHALTQGSDTLLLDVTPLSLGIETMGGLVEKIIHRNTPIPVSKSQEFTTYQDGQTAMTIHVIQGEREMVADCRSLAKFVLTDIPSKIAGATRIEVNFMVDADGMLTVSAKELTTGKIQTVHVKPSYGLSENELIEMIRSSQQNAENDMNKRLLMETIVDAERLIHSVIHALSQDSDLLDPKLQEYIENRINDVREKIARQDKDAIKESCEELDKCVQEFAELRMNKAINEALQGKNIDNVFEG